MAEQEEPLYDFPEPSQISKFKGHQRTRGSLKSISVLDRLLLTVPVWLQLSINPATALHILQREPPGTFLVRNSRTSQKKVLCVRLADNSEPSFVQQFDIKEELSTFSLVTSAITFPDLPRLISFYCVSRDVLPFPLELPEAIARATSHKELESISHMGIEFWSSHLNVRGPREAPKPQKERKPDSAPTVPTTPVPQTTPEGQPKSENQSKPNTHPTTTASERQPVKEDSNTALFNEFCPLKTRSPNEVNYGSGIGALCFINPLFLQSLNAWSRRRMFKRSLKIRVSTETSTLLSPPLSAPPPPPLVPKSKGRCKAGKQDTKTAHAIKDTTNVSQDDKLDQKAQTNPTDGEDYTELPSRTREDITKVLAEIATLPTVKESLVEDSDYMQPSPVVSSSNPLASHLSPKIQPKKSLSLSPRGSPSTSPSVSPYQSPSPSPKVPFPLSPITSVTSVSPVVGDAYDIPAPFLKTDQQLSQVKDKSVEKLNEKEENKLVQQINTASLHDKDSLKDQVPTESSALLLPPPLMPKSKGRRKAGKQDTKAAQSIKYTYVLQNDTLHQKMYPTVEEDYVELPSRTREDIIKVIAEVAPLSTVKESLVEDSDYMQPSPVVSSSYPLVSHLPPKLQPKKTLSPSPRGSPNISPSVSPYQSPSPSPKVPFPLSPFTSATSVSPLVGDAYDIPAPFLKTDQQLSQVKDKSAEKLTEKEENELVQQINTASLKDSFKDQVPTESSTLLLPPPLMPKSKGRRNAGKQDTKAAQSVKNTTNVLQDDKLDQKAQTNPTDGEDYTELPSRTKEDIRKVLEEVSLLPTVASVSRMADDAYDIPTSF